MHNKWGAEAGGFTLNGLQTRPYEISSVIDTIKADTV